VKSRSASSRRRRPQPRSTARIALSRFPFKVSGGQVTARSDVLLR
jgi:hypothetical protein